MKTGRVTLRLLSIFSLFVYCVFFSQGVIAQSVEPQPEVQPKPVDWWDRSVPAPGRGSISPEKAALLGVVPGLGQLVLGNDGSGITQSLLFVGSIASAGSLASKKHYIPFDERRVTYDINDVILGRELTRNGFLYSDNPTYLFLSDRLFDTSLETNLDRNARLLHDRKIAETNPLIEYGEYNRTNTVTEMSAAYGLMAQSTIFYSIYSSYRDAGGGRHDEKIEELLIAPYQWKYISSPWVYVPIVALAAAVGASKPGNETTLVNDSFMKDGSREFLTVYISMNAAVAEEAFFRGFLNDSLTKHHGPITGGGISGSIFGLAHLQSGASIASVLPQALFGYYFAFLQYRNQGDIREGIAVHFWWDAILFAYQYRSYKADSRHSRSKREINFMPFTYTMRF